MYDLEANNNHNVKL